MSTRAERRAHLEAWIREHAREFYYEGTSYVEATTKYHLFAPWNREAGDRRPRSSAARMCKTALALGVQWRGRGIRLSTRTILHGSRHWARLTVLVAQYLNDFGGTNLWAFADFVNRAKAHRMSVPEIMQCLRRYRPFGGDAVKYDRDNWQDYDTTIVPPTRVLEAAR